MKFVVNHIVAVVWKKYSLLQSLDALAMHQQLTDNAFYFQKPMNKLSISVVLDVDSCPAGHVKALIPTHICACNLTFMWSLSIRW